MDTLSTPDASDPRWFRWVLGQNPTGVCVVTATEADGRRAGFVVGSFASVSLNPPLVAFCPDKNSRSWRRIHRVGRFCVNILSAEQEDICRTFASSKKDKFEGIDCRESTLGSPIIKGAVAWIDCDIESVTEAGDHYLALGRVRELEVQSTSLPLLFFQGGYGRFSPLSLAADSRGLVTQLREVDMVRPEMEGIVADIPGAYCNASALVDDEIVVLASAGVQHTTPPATFVGEHLPFTPPLGRVFAAWMEDDAVERWLRHLPTEQRRHDERRWLAEVRNRGFSMVLRAESWQRLQSSRARRAADPQAVELEELHRRIRELDHMTTTLAPDDETDIGVLRVPVFGRGGNVAIQLGVYGFPVSTASGMVHAYVERIRGAARQATVRLGGRIPRIRRGLADPRASG